MSRIISSLYGERSTERSRRRTCRTITPKTHDEVQNPKLDKAEFVQKTVKLQMPFIANNGQVYEQVIFYAKIFGGTVFVTKDGEIVYSLPMNCSELRVQDSECRVELHSPREISPVKRGDFVVSKQSNDKGVCNKPPNPNNKNETHLRSILIEESILAIL